MILAWKLIFAEGGKPGNPAKNTRSQIEINQSQPTYEPRIEPGSQWWEARMMTAAPTNSPFVCPLHKQRTKQKKLGTVQHDTAQQNSSLQPISPLTPLFLFYKQQQQQQQQQQHNMSNLCLHVKTAKGPCSLKPNRKAWELFDHYKDI